MLQFENLESRREIIVADLFRMVGAVVQDRDNRFLRRRCATLGNDKVISGA